MLLSQHRSHRRPRPTGQDGAHHGGGGTWLVSYADMVTLIMAFFIVMYTMSQIDINKLKALVGSLNAAFDPRPSGFKASPRDEKRGSGEESLVPGGNASVVRVAPTNGVKRVRGMGQQNRPSRPAKSLEEVAQKVEEVAKNSGLQNQVKTEVTARGTVVSFAETADGLANVVPFASGSAQLTDGFRAFLDKVAPILDGLTNKIEVQGHTDRRPIHTVAFPSNWELSGARAGSVVRYLCEAHGLSQRMFVCSGFADTMPADTSDTPQAWARNRRIEIVITRNPVEVYDALTRDQATGEPTDITQPLGPALISVDLPKAVGGAAEPAPADEPSAPKAADVAHPGADKPAHASP